MIGLERIENSDPLKYPTLTLTDYYDVIHKLLESISLSSGEKMNGDGAHQKLINFVSKKMGLSENGRQFLQELRTLRNQSSLL